MHLDLKTEQCLPSAGLTGLEPPFTDIEANVQAATPRFAKDALGRELDRMEAAQVIALALPCIRCSAKLLKMGLSRDRRAR